jgi:hypothetical protein
MVRTGLEFASELIAHDAQACKGKFASGRKSDLIDSDVVFWAFTSCSDSQGERTLQYYITPWRKTDFAVFTVLSIPASDRTQAPTDPVDETLYKKAAVGAVEAR